MIYHLKKSHRIMSSSILLITLYKFEYWWLENGGFYFSMFCQWKWQSIVIKCAANYGNNRNLCRFMEKSCVCFFFHSVRLEWKYEKYARHIQMNFARLRSNKWQFFFHFISFDLNFAQMQTASESHTEFFFFVLSLLMGIHTGSVWNCVFIVNAKP